MSATSTGGAAGAVRLDGLGQLLPRLAARWPDRTALVTDDRTTTYAELDRFAARVAHGLVRRGVRPGDRVALLSQNRWEWVAAYHGALRCGAVVNPLNVMLTGEELAYVLSDSGAKVLMASRDRLDAAAGALRGVATLERSICFDEPPPGAEPSMSCWSSPGTRPSSPWPSGRTPSPASRTRQGRRAIPRARCSRSSHWC